MKAHCFFLLLLLCGCADQTRQKFKEQSIDGTWLRTHGRQKMLYIYYKSYSFFISRDRDSDSFLVAGVASYRINGNSIVEQVISSTWGGSRIVSTSAFRVHGDSLFHDGVDSLEGRQLTSFKMLSIRAPSASKYSGDKVGLWYRIDQGQFYSKNGEGRMGKDITTYQLVTLTYWFRIGLLDDNKVYAMSGPYKMVDDTLVGTISYSSLPFQHARFSLTQRQEGQSPYWVGDIKDSTGRKTFHFQDTSMLRIACL